MIYEKSCGAVIFTEFLLECLQGLAAEGATRGCRPEVWRDFLYFASFTSDYPKRLNGLREEDHCPTDEYGLLEMVEKVPL